MELTPLFADLAHFLLFILRDWWDITAGALIVMAIIYGAVAALQPLRR
ncbi:MAG: hypothetical protein R3E31_31165 [Chloroflexota bacterium]|nr:hypothetical protein [Anaerolineales bacterium]